MPIYVEVLLPLALEERYHYVLEHLPEGRDVESLLGCRVLVSFGVKRFYTGVIAEVCMELGANLSAKKLKTIEQIIDEKPLVSREQLALWRWTADYYHCHVGQVMRLAVPGGLLPESKTLIYLNPNFAASERLGVDEERMLDTLALAGAEGLTLLSLQTRLGQSLGRVYERLLKLGAIHTEEAVHSRYRPKMKAYLRLTEAYCSEEGVNKAFALLGRAMRQKEMLLDFLRLQEEQALALDGLIARTALARGDAGRLSLIRKLLERGVLEMVEQADSRIARQEYVHEARTTKPEARVMLGEGVNLLVSEDIQAKEQAIVALVAEYIARGEQVLLLSPSAHDSPNSQVYISALERASGGAMYLYHNQVSEAKRCELYQHLAQKAEPCLVVGTRQSVFLPLPRLGLIIVDEEQEYLYKQQFAPPYYHARDVALYLGATNRHKILLTSSSPSAEASFNALRGKYHLLSLGQTTIQPQQLPSIKTIDIAKLRDRGLMPYGRSISPELQSEIERQLVEGRRVLILQNRRGYAPYVRCRQCQEGISCPNCDVSLNYYARERALRCHYCAYTMFMPPKCPSCGASQVETPKGTEPALYPIGYGSERVEEELSDLFPEARIMRLDSDSLQTARQRAEVRQRIEAGDVDIIVGTQLIKGQSLWDNVGLIAVVYLDAILGFPDFRNEERAYQLLYQLMLRSARSEGKEDCALWIQTAQPAHPFIASLRARDYSRFVKMQLLEREVLGFPPFVRLSLIKIKGRDEALVELVARQFAVLLGRELQGIRVSEAQRPSVARIEGQYIWEIVCRRPYNMPYRAEREAMRRAEVQLRHLFPESKKLQIHYDIDPL